MKVIDHLELLNICKAAKTDGVCCCGEAWHEPHNFASDIAFKLCLTRWSSFIKVKRLNVGVSGAVKMENYVVRVLSGETP